MKGVMNKLSFSLGKKKREAQKTSTETSEQPSTVPDEHQPDTDTGFFDDPQNIGPNTSGVTEYETSTEVLQEGACSSLEIPEETLIQTSQREKFKLYNDPVESKIKKDSTPQEIPYAISDSDRVTGDGKKYRDGTKTDRYVFGLDEDTRDSEVRQAYNHNAKDAAYCLPGEHETLVSEVPQIFLRDRHDDDGIVETSDFLPSVKEVHYPIERAEKEYVEMPAPTFKEFRERDKNLTFDVNPPQLIHYSPEDPRIIRSHFKSDPESDIKSADYLYAKSDRMSQIPVQDSGNYIGGLYFNPRLKEEAFSVCNPREKGPLQSERDLADRLYKKSNKKRSIGFIDESYPYRPNDKDITLKYDDGLEKDQIKPDTIEMQKDNGGFDNYAEASYYTYRSSGDNGNLNIQYKQGSPMYDQHQRYISDGKTFYPDCQIDVDSCRREYYSNTASDSHLKGGKLDKQRREEAFDKQGSDPDEISRDDFIEKIVVTKKTKEHSRPIFIDPKRPNPLKNSQNPPVNSNIKSEDKDNSYLFNKDNRSKHDTSVNPAYKTRNLKTFKNRALVKSNDDTFGRHLSLFGRWMVTHGHLVDPYDFCLWSYASRPEEYIDLSKYQMDLRGRWLDASGCSVTPFFYCYSYDGEPIYLGDCDCYDVFKNSYDATTNDSENFANNPERFIDLSDFQMDMEERWRDCDGRYVDPFSEWYAIGSPENEISEYDWFFNKPETLALSRYPGTMYDYFEDYFDINPFLPKSNVMITDIPDLEDYLFSENYIFWDYPTRYPSNIPGLFEDPSNMTGLWPDTEHIRNVSKGIKAVGDGDRSDTYDRMKYRSKKKTK